MPIQSSVVKQNATSFTVVGGTDLTFAPDGVVVPSGTHVSVPADTDFRIRRNLTFRNRPPVYQNGIWSKGKQSFVFQIPIILADGSVSFDLFRGEREMHPEGSAAHGLELLFVSAQILFDSDFATFWSGGSVL